MTNQHLEYIEVNPPGKPSATIIWLHGLGVDGHDFEPIVPELQIMETLPVRFVFPHAPRRAVTLNAGMVMPAWYDILDIENSPKVNVHDILESCNQLRELIKSEIELGMPPERIVLAGFSQGGTIALYTGLKYEEKLAGIMALSTALHTTDRLAEELSESNLKIPILMAHGTMDPLVRIENAVSTRKALTRLGYNIRWHEYPVGHTVCDEEIQDIRSWIFDVLM